jgi:hypothetical protein
MPLGKRERLAFAEDQSFFIKEKSLLVKKGFLVGKSLSYTHNIFAIF